LTEACRERSTILSRSLTAASFDRRDGGEYVTALSKSEAEQAALADRGALAAARDRIVMLAEIAMRQALDHSALFRVG
jgi:hypothetical protein